MVWIPFSQFKGRLRYTARNAGTGVAMRDDDFTCHLHRTLSRMLQVWVPVFHHLRRRLIHKLQRVCLIQLSRKNTPVQYALLHCFRYAS